jgi:DNA-binding XRE family transcriptional regulator
MNGSTRGLRLSTLTTQILDNVWGRVYGPSMSKIAEVRIAHGMTQEQVARQAGLALNTVKNIERTGRGHSDNVRAIARVLGVPLDDLFDEATA